MSACKRSLRGLQGGFSLVELLVALVFTSLLMAGMFRIFQASASQFTSQLETMGIQRRARFGLLWLQDDLFQAGYHFPPGVEGALTGSGQDPLTIGTGSTKVTTTDPAGNTVDLGFPDELQVYMDIPLGVEGSLSAAAKYGDSSLSVTVPSGASTLQDGDIAWIQDSQPYEFFLVTPSVSGTDVTLAIKGGPGGGTLTDALGNDVAAGGAHPIVTSQAHFANAPVTFIRPQQVVRYTIQSLKLDAETTANTPCLVRQTRSLSSTTWSDPTILMDGVTRFALDWSLDGGKTWVRQANGLTASDWSDVKTATDTAFKAQGSPLTKSLPGGLSSITDPIWFNYVPVTLKVELETQTQIKRTDYTSVSNTADYRTRRQTILISLRNSSLGAP